MATPRDIYAELGEKLSHAILEGDYQSYRRLIGLPLAVSPRNGAPYVLETWEQLEKDFAIYQRNTQLHRVTDIYREQIEADYTAPEEITARFKTHILAGAQELVPPFEQTHVLRKAPDGWVIRKMISSLGHVNWTLGRAEIKQGGFVDASPGRFDTSHRNNS